MLALYKKGIVWSIHGGIYSFLYTLKVTWNIDTHIELQREYLSKKLGQVGCKAKGKFFSCKFSGRQSYDLMTKLSTCNY